MRKTLAIVPLLLPVLSAQAQNDSDLAQQLTNPLADLYSLPIQGNMDFGIGPGDGQRFFTNIQPVIPVSLNEDWNMVSRTIFPLIDQEGIDLAGDTDAFGLGDTVQSLFFSPKSEGTAWGIGPVFLLPTATDSALGGDNWGMGPTGVIFMKSGAWTYGGLVNHIWDVAGDSDTGVNATFLQPFVSYTLPSATTFSLNTESTYDWDGNQWTVPINFQVSQLIKTGGPPVSVFAGIRYYAEASDQGPDWGFRLGLTILFPKG